MDEGLKKEIVSSCVARIDFYRFLASIYKTELTDEQIEKLAHQRFPRDDSKIGDGYALISEFLRHRDSGTRQQLAVDYAYVFLAAGNYHEIMAPPYESVYTSEERLLMQDARDDVLRFYRREGLDLPADNMTPEDHLSFEMQFMAMLIEQSAEALRVDDAVRFDESVSTQKTFFEQHLANWLPAFTADILRLSKTDFYKGIALLTQGLMEAEEEILAALKDAEGIEAA